jgi:hypothetical protein
MRSVVSWNRALLALTGLVLASPARATILSTSNQSQVDAFSVGAEVENFDDLDSTVASSYAAGQNATPASRFSTRDGTTAPTFHSGGASPNDPVGNPGTPIAIVTPSGAIIGDVASGENVGAPVVVSADELWNGGFMEVIFPSDVNKVGFWVTGGSAHLFLRDRFGSNLATGDVDVIGNAGTFIGIERPAADISVAAIVANGGDFFTIDDFTHVPEAPAPLGAVVGALVLTLARRFRPARA